MEYLTNKQKKTYITILVVAFYVITIASQIIYILTDMAYINYAPIYYSRIFVSLIISVFLFTSLRKWYDNNDYKLAVSYILIVFIYVFVSNIADYAVNSIQYKYVFYQTFFQIFKSFFLASFAAFISLVFILYIASKLPKNYTVSSFYVPLVVKYLIVFYMLITVIVLLHMGTNISSMERGYVERSAYQTRVDIANMRSGINQYISSLATKVRYDANIIAGNIYRSSGGSRVDRAFIDSYILNDLNLIDDDAKKTFSKVSICLFDDYTYENDLSAVLFINDDGSYVYQFFNNPDVIDINEYSELGKDSGIFVKFVSEEQNNIYISVVSEIRYANKMYGYVEFYVSPSHLINIISSYTNIYSDYSIIDVENDLILASNNKNNVGRTLSSFFENIHNGRQFIEHFKNIKVTEDDIFFHNGNEDSVKIDDYYIYASYIKSLDVAFVQIMMSENFFVSEQISSRVNIYIYIYATIFFLIAAGVIFGIFITGMIKPLREAIEYTNTLSQGYGDLTKRVKNINNDETGVILYNYNAFLDNLNKAMLNFKKENTVLSADSKEIVEMLSKNSDTIMEQMSSISSTVDSLSTVLSSISKIGDSTQQQKYAFSSANIAIEELLKMILTINENMEKQSTAVAQTSASIEEMISNISSVAKSVENADRYARKLLDEARSGEDIVDNVIDAIREIEESSDQIKEIITVIQGIAEQTNLLAMNAAIEAAHAGEQGKGFAVVADEIRSLAEHTADNTKSITAIIKEITKRVTNTVDLALGSGHSLENILTTSDRTARVVSEINLANSEIEVGGKEILDSVHNLNTITQVVKDSVEEQIQNGNIVESQIVLLDKITQEVSNAIIKNTSSSNEINESLSFLTSLSDKIGETNTFLYTGIKKINESFTRLGGFMDAFVFEESADNAAVDDDRKKRFVKTRKKDKTEFLEDDASLMDNELHEILNDLRANGAGAYGSDIENDGLEESDNDV